MGIKVDYSETMNTIIDGLVRFNEKQIVGNLLTKGVITLYDLENNNELEKSIRSHLEQTAYQVLRSLKDQLGDDLQIFSENDEIMTDK